MTSQLFAVSSGALLALKLGRHPFSAWLHFERSWEASDEHRIRNLVNAGCRLVMNTGRDSNEVQEQIDWIAADATEQMVLTFSSKSICRESSFEFMITHCPGVQCHDRAISVISKDIEHEIEGLLRIAKSIETSGFQKGLR